MRFSLPPGSLQHQRVTLQLPFHYTNERVSPRNTILYLAIGPTLPVSPAASFPRTVTVAAGPSGTKGGAAAFAGSAGRSEAEQMTSVRENFEIQILPGAALICTRLCALSFLEERRCCVYSSCQVEEVPKQQRSLHCMPKPLQP